MEGSGGTEEDVLPLAAAQSLHQIAGEHAGAAAAARASGVDVLVHPVENKQAAVGVAVGQVDPVPLEQFQQQRAAQLPRSPVTMRS